MSWGTFKYAWIIFSLWTNHAFKSDSPANESVKKHTYRFDSIKISTMFKWKERRVFWIVTAVLLIMVTAPFLYAQASAGEEYHFSGLLFNPIDGNSYLAKMYEGYRGEWLFTLPYTADKGQGAFLYTFYLFLGHVARWSGISLEFIFHIARIISILLMLIAIWRYLSYVLSGTRMEGSAFIWAVFGLGLGWLTLPFGHLPSDLWVAEAYPFLSSLTNPHFPLSLAIVLYFLTPRNIPDSGQTPGSLSRIIHYLKLNWFDLPLGILLASLSAFGAVLVGLILAILSFVGYIFSDNVTKSELWLSRAIWLLIGGGAMTVYQVLVMRSNPNLAAWNVQNVTTTPPVWDILLTFSPALIVAIPTAFFAYKLRKFEILSVVVWIGLTLILIWAPFNLQRRFLLGFYLPCVALAIFGLQMVSKIKWLNIRLLLLLMLILSLPSNLILYIGAYTAIQNHDSRIYIHRSEDNALRWIQQNANQDDLILAEPDLSLYIPAKTGMRVVYGHPFETVNSEARLTEVLQFYAGEMSETKTYDWMQSFGVDYVFIDMALPAARILEAYPFLTLKYNYGGTIGIYSFQAAESSSGDLRLE